MKANNDVCKETRAQRRRKGLEKIRRIYGENTYTWEIPALFAMETDPAKKGTLLAVLDILSDNDKERATEERERIKKVAAVAQEEFQRLMVQWGLT